jgi:hypothetical protein
VIADVKYFFFGELNLKNTSKAGTPSLKVYLKEKRMGSSVELEARKSYRMAWNTDMNLETLAYVSGL